MEWQAGMIVTKNGSLEAHRQAIDAIDGRLMFGLQLRRVASKAAQKVKKRRGLPVLNRARERAIRERFEANSPGLGAVAAAILKWCRNEN
jgi:chorismate mutase